MIHRVKEILPPLKLMEGLLLVSVRPGFHPGRGVKSTSMLPEADGIHLVRCSFYQSLIKYCLENINLG